MLVLETILVVVIVAFLTAFTLFFLTKFVLVVIAARKLYRTQAQRAIRTKGAVPGAGPAAPKRRRPKDFDTLIHSESGAEFRIWEQGDSMDAPD